VINYLRVKKLFSLTLLFSLAKPETLHRLLDLITVEPAEDAGEKERFR